MECPNCHHASSAKGLLRCSQCGKEYDRQALEEFERLLYLQTWLQTRRQVIGEPAGLLLEELNAQLSELRLAMHLAQPVVVKAPPVPIMQAVPILAEAAHQPPQASMAAIAIEPPVMAVTTPVEAPLPRTLPTQPAPPPRPPAPPRPPIDWGKLWDRALNFVVSGALLRALLYMGAFMIVVSAAVLVINFWNRFHPVLQVAFIFALPSAFYAGGWVTRGRLKLEQAGMVLTGIGAVLLAVDFAALYQFTHLTLDLNVFWLIASLICTAVYIFTVWRLKGEFFAALMYLGALSILLAFSRVMRAPAGWTVAVVPLASTAMMALGISLGTKGEKWNDSARMARFLPQVLTPLSLITSLFAGGPVASQAAAFAGAAGVYAMLAWRSPSTWALGAALASLTVTTGLLSHLVEPANLWMASVISLLAAVYIYSGQRYFSRESAPKGYRSIFLIAGFALSLVVFAAGLLLVLTRNRAEGALALTILAVSFCAWNVLLRRDILGFMGAMLIFLPFWVWTDLAGLQTGAIPLALLLLISLFHLPMAILVRRLEPRLAAPFELIGGLASMAVLVLVFSIPRQGNSSLPEVTAGLLTLYYLFNTWHYRHALFAWAGALSFPLTLLIAFIHLDLPAGQAALGWILVAFAYLFIGQALARSAILRFARMPFNVGALALAVVTLGYSIASYFVFPKTDTSIPLALVSWGLVVGFSFICARVWQSKWPLFFEPGLAWILVSLFFNAYDITLIGRKQVFSDYGLLLSATAVVHLLLAAALDRRSVRYSHNLYLGAYSLAGLAVFICGLDALFTEKYGALLWTFGVFLAAMLFSAILEDLGRHRTWNDLFTMLTPAGSLHGGSVFLWPLACLLPLWCMVLLTYLGVPSEWRWMAFCLPALIYLPTGALLNRRNEFYSRPFSSAAHAFIALALVSNIGPVLRLAFELCVKLGSARPASIVMPSLSQVFVLLAALIFYAAWGWMRRRRVFAHIASWLSILLVVDLSVLIGLSATNIILAWMVWAIVLMMAGFLLDRLPKESPRHSHGSYLAGYTLALVVLIVSIPWTVLNIEVLGLCILASAASFLAMHFGWHRGFADFIDFFFKPDTLQKRAARMAFLFVAVYALPFFVLQIGRLNGWMPAWQGISLALLAPLLIAGGLIVRRARPDYNWPFYSAGYALTVIAPLFILYDERLLTYALALDVAIYAASARIFRQSVWLYMASFLAPATALLALHSYQSLTQQWVAWVFTIFAFLYFGLGQWLERRLRQGWLSAFTLPLYIPAVLLSAGALLVAYPGRSLALFIYPAHMLLYALAAWRFRRTVFIYPAAWLSVLPYQIIISSYLGMPAQWQGLAWLPLVLLSIGLGRFVFEKMTLKRAAWPLYLMGYALSVNMIVISRFVPLPFTVVLVLASALYLGSALLFRHPAWLYPTLICAHLAILAFFSIHPTDSPARFISLPFMILTWFEALVALVVSRLRPAASLESLPGVFAQSRVASYLVTPSWSQPIFIVMIFDTLLWEAVALTGLETGLWVSAGFFLLYTLLATLWQDKLLAWLGLGLGALAWGLQLRLLGWDVAPTFAALSGLAQLFYLLSWLADLLKGRLAVWQSPLERASILLSALGLLGTLPVFFFDSIPTALALGLGGALFLTMSLRRRSFPPGYLGVGLLLLGWSLLLFRQNIAEPQWYAIPAGLYFTGMGFLERLRRPGRFAQIVEGLGLALLLLTSFIQSLNGQAGFPYFLLLLVEGLAVVWWGAMRHLRMPFIAGLAASVLNVLAQLVLLARINDIYRWVIILGTGFLIVGLGLFIERRREMLLSRSQELRAMLEKWD